MSYSTFIYGSEEKPPDNAENRDPGEMFDLNELAEETDDEFGGQIISLEDIPEEVKYLYIVRF